MSDIIKHNDLQMVPIEQAKEWYNQFAEFTRSILKKDIDFGVIPGTPKPSLLKAGAEKLRFAYGLGIEFQMVDNTVDFNRPFIDYSYKCTVKSKQGQILSECEGSCNSMEAKFGWLWVPENEIPASMDTSNLKSKTGGKKMMEFDFAISKAETTGQYGKPAAYWQQWKDDIKSGKAKKIMKATKSGKEMDAYEINDTQVIYRIPNPDAIGLKNTIMKMAQKRAFVGAVLIATGASEFFTQDMEDIIDLPVESVQDIPAEVVEPIKPFTFDQWKAMLDKCDTKREMLALYVKYKDQVEGSVEVQKMFTLKRNSFALETPSGTGTPAKPF